MESLSHNLIGDLPSKRTSFEMESGRTQSSKRKTPLPVLPPRIPTPMPLANNNNLTKSSHAREQQQQQQQQQLQQVTKIHPSSVAVDGAQLISKACYKLLDNDVKTAWINPRLISKIDMEMVRSTEYILPSERNMNGHYISQNNSSSYSQKQSNHQSYQLQSQQQHPNHQQQQQQQQGRGASHHQDREWEPSVNGRPKHRVSSSVVAAVPTLTQSTSDARREKSERKNTRQQQQQQQQQLHSNELSTSNKTLNKHQTSCAMQQQQPTGGRVGPNEIEKLLKNSSASSSVPATCIPVSKSYQQQSKSKYSPHVHKTSQKVPERIKGVVGGGSYQSAAGLSYVGGGLTIHEGGVFGVYSETKYMFAVNGLPNNTAQASAAAAFFARAAQKLNLSSSPHRRKRHNSEDAEPSGFCGVLQRSPPPVPPALLRRIGVKEITGVGKVKVMLRVSTPSSGGETGSTNGFFSLDKRKKQVTLLDPSTCGGSAAPEDRRVGVAAPKMFAFDAIFSQDDSQTEVCSSALTDVIHAVINGTDGCLFCFGHAGLGKSYTMLGAPDNANTLGIIPSAISWLFRGINEQKQKTGARFSVRVSAVEVCGPTNQLRDLLAGHSNDSEQSPGVYLRDDPLFGNQPPHCELRVPTAERAAHYLDAAVECRAPTREDVRDSHLLFTLHVYQYSVAGKGGVAGGRSRLHLIDLGNSERGKASGGIPLSGLGNILLAIFNGQKHLPYKEHKLTHLLKDCLSSLTCHAAMIAHVSPYAQNYSDTLTTVQLASRIHRMRRRRIKFVSAGTGNGSGGSSGEEAAKTTGTSSEPDPSSSDLSADTVIYVGPADDATDGEHPPVYIPSLNSGDNRCSMSKALRGSSAEQKPKTSQKIDEKPNPHRQQAKVSSNKTSPAHANSPKSSPSRLPTTKTKAQPADVSKHNTNPSDEQWIDGPRISKSKVAEARHFMKESCHVKKRETWIDGPMQVETSGYGYMDSHKKNMIRKWVEHQTSQIQRTKHVHPKDSKAKDHFKELTQFKTYDEEMTKPLDVKRQEILDESHMRGGLKITNVKSSDMLPECLTPEEKEEERIEDDDYDEEEPEIPPALPLIQPLSSREVSLESLDMLLKERLISNAEYNYHNAYEEQQGSDEDEVLEIIEVEEPLEPVPTQDCCLQVTEEDIALCMGFRENPLPEVDQENPLDHPLRILSQENLTVVSTFTDSMSIYTDLERILPRNRYDPKYGMYNDDYEDPDNPHSRNTHHIDETAKQKFDQLARLHELYSNRLAKANVANSETFQKHSQSQKLLTRCESLTLTDMLYGPPHDNSSIYSEPAYIPNQEKFCENCKVSMSRPATAQNWYADPHLSASSMELSTPAAPLSGRFQRYTHKYSKDNSNLAYLRHPDGASNPNLREETERVPGNGACDENPQPNLILPLPPPNSLPSNERINRRMFSIESGLAAIKLNQKQSEGYDSGHDSTPRTSKHSPAAISRKAESGYDSVVRDSESSSIDSDTSRLSHLHNRRGKCKHKHEKSFCSWFLNPFTCKYIDEPPETHF